MGFSDDFDKKTVAIFIQFIKAILFFNMLLLPVYLFFFYVLFEQIYYSKDYKLQEVEITKIWESTSSGDFSINIDYVFRNDKTKRGSVYVQEYSDAARHFSQLSDNCETCKLFEKKVSPGVGEYIWVWHNPNANTIYAFGSNDTITWHSKKVNREFLTLLPFLLLSIGTVIYFFGPKKKINDQQ